MDNYDLEPLNVSHRNRTKGKSDIQTSYAIWQEQRSAKFLKKLNWYRQQLKNSQNVTETLYQSKITLATILSWSILLNLVSFTLIYHLIKQALK